MKLQPENLVELLDKNTVTFSFRKVDGSIRRMRATRCPKVIPHELQTGTYRPHDPKRSAVVVYDVDAVAWRSYRSANVCDIHQVEEA